MQNFFNKNFTCSIYRAGYVCNKSLLIVYCNINAVQWLCHILQRWLKHVGWIVVVEILRKNSAIMLKFSNKNVKYSLTSSSLSINLKQS